MTPNCIKEVLDLQSESDKFCDLTVEQLLYAAIIGTDIDEVRMVLNTTNWEEYCPGRFSRSNHGRRKTDGFKQRRSRLCTCMTKSPDWEHHEADCEYRISMIG